MSATECAAALTWFYCQVTDGVKYWDRESPGLPILCSTFRSLVHLSRTIR